MAIRDVFRVINDVPNWQNTGARRLARVTRTLGLLAIGLGTIGTMALIDEHAWRINFYPEDGLKIGLALVVGFLFCALVWSIGLRRAYRLEVATRRAQND